MFNTNLTTQSATAHTVANPSSIKYQAELKASNSSATNGLFSKWGSPARVYVRGYDSTGKRVYSEEIGMCDKRYRGSRSYCYKLMQEAHERAAELQAADMTTYQRLPHRP